MARSVENTATSFIPFTDDSETRDDLLEITEKAQQISKMATRIYNTIAREAFQA